MTTKLTDVISMVQVNGGSAVMVQRHGAYMSGHVAARCSDPHVLTARNLAGVEPSWMWPLSFTAIQECHEQARRLYEAGIKPVEIWGSEQGRGPHTGQCLSEGYSMAGGGWIPFWSQSALNFPSYHFGNLLALLRKGAGDEFVADWFNGWHSGLTTEDPTEFFVKIADHVAHKLAMGPGLRILTSHFEIVTAIRAAFVAKQRPGTVDRTWFPAKNGGIIVWRLGKTFYAQEYTPGYEMVGPVGELVAGEIVIRPSRRR